MLAGVNLGLEGVGRATVGMAWRVDVVAAKDFLTESAGGGLVAWRADKFINNS